MAKRYRRTTRLEASLAATGVPVFALDARRRLVFFNSGCERLTGWTADELIGNVFDYASDPDHSQPTTLSGSLSPPPEVESGVSLAVPATLVCRDGRTVARMVHFFPLTGAEDEVEKVLGIITPLEQTSRLAAATPAQTLHAELAALRVSLRQRFGLETLVCRSDAMLRVADQIRVARETDAGVLLTGERGTGKEHIARILHGVGEAAARSFVPLDCLQLPAFELKQTLRRLFPDEQSEEDSYLLGLQPGTVYLTNVESLPRDLQEFVVGGCRTSPPWRARQRRLLAASCAPLDSAVAAELLRPDFYYLLTTISIELPPLRNRPDDLQPLAQSIIEDLNRGDDKQIGGCADDVALQFREYNWPGNVDELVAVLTEARTAATGDLIQKQDLPFRFLAGREAQAVGPATTTPITPLEELLSRVEAEEIQRALAQARNNKTKAAELLEITRPRLYRRMQALGIDDTGG